MDWLKAIANALGLADTLARWMKSRQDEAAGAAKQAEKTDETTMENLQRVGRPISAAESDELWDKTYAEHWNRRSKPGK